MYRKILLFCFILTAPFANASTQTSTHSAPAVDSRGTEANPLVVEGLPVSNPVVVRVLPIERSHEDIAQEKKDREEKRASDQEATRTSHILVWIGVLQTLVFALQFVAFAYQSKSLDQTVTAAGEQSKDMKRYVDEASRSATAMEGMATAMKANVVGVTDAFAMQKVIFRNQLRPWVAVSFRGCMDQDTTKEFKFEVQSDIKNAGNTPAIEANTASALRVFPVPLPDDVDLTIPMENLGAASTLPPHSPALYIRTVLPAFLDAAEVAQIKEATTKRLYVYGTTRYKDIFGEMHFTNFCWSIGWTFDGKPVATNASRHNDAN